MTFRSTTETQLTKLEEESQKALAAAEAGIEAALSGNFGSSISINSLPGFTGSGFTGQASVGTILENEFVTPLLQRDQQYTFYLADAVTFSNPYNGIIIVYYGNSTDDCNGNLNDQALEFTIVYDDPATVDAYDITRYIAETGGRLANYRNVARSGGKTIKGVTFYCQTDPFFFGTLAPMIPNSRILFVRTLFNTSAQRIGFERGPLSLSSALPVQGKYVTSEARSSTGVTKRVRLFQSYPQIPAEFVVTSF